MTTPRIRALGILLAAAGLVLPSGVFLTETLSGPAASQRLLGALLFRAGLVALGAWLFGVAKVLVRESPADETGDAAPGVGWALGGVLLAALALRMYRLGAGLWLDEIYTYVHYARLPFREIVLTFDSENQHFLFTLLAHACFRLFGESAWALRLPAALFGVASIWALYQLTREVGSRREAMFAALLMAATYHHVWFSQNARGYTGLLFWTTLSSWLLARGLRTGAPGTWLLYGVAAALGTYTHLTMAFVLVGHGIIYLVRLASGSRDWMPLLVGFPFAGLLIFLLHAPVLPQVFGGIAKTHSDVVEWRNPLWTALELARGLRVGFAGSAVAAGALLAFGTGLRSYARSNPIVLQLLVIPPLIGSAVVIGMGHHLWPRFFLFALGFATLVLVRGTLTLGEWAGELLARRWQVSVPVGPIFTGVIIALSAASVPFAYGPKQDFLGALSYVEASRDPGDRVVTVGLATFPYRRLYKVDWLYAETVEEFEAARAHPGRTWLLYTLEPVLEARQPLVLERVRRDFKLVRTFSGTLQNGTVYVYRSDGSAARAAARATAGS
jgi:hypothetical protein